MSATIEIPSPVGPLTLEAQGGRLTAVRFAGRADAHVGGDPTLAACARQLEEYFSGARHGFALPLSLPTAPFDRKVLTAVAEVPFGERTTYGAVTRAVGLGLEDVRAVAAAIGRNPLPIVVPCHRVIGADGSLTGYGGGLARKARLLALESGQLELGLPASPVVA
jgi:methylated-DNA-[protein]-cysteine S-methyltransferase